MIQGTGVCRYQHAIQRRVEIFLVVSRDELKPDCLEHRLYYLQVCMCSCKHAGVLVINQDFFVIYSKLLLVISPS